MQNEKQNSKFLKEVLLLDRITSDSDIPDPIPVIKIGNRMFAQKGDLSFVAGPPKAGKTAVCTITMAGALIPPEEKYKYDTLDIETVYCDGKPIIYIDTEQPKSNTKKIAKSICSILKVKKEPDNLYIFNFRDFPRSEKVGRVLSLFEHFPDAHLWIIDGLADLIGDVNHAGDSFEIIDKFMVLSSRYATTVILLLHENPGNFKMRGHAGSEAERKGGGVIKVRKDKENQVHSIECHILRNDEDFETIFFKWIKNKSGFGKLTVEESEVQKQLKDKHNQKLLNLKNTAINCFRNLEEQLSWVVLRQRIIEIRKVKASQANNIRRAMVNNYFISNDNPARLYCLTTQENSGTFYSNTDMAF